MLSDLWQAGGGQVSLDFPSLAIGVVLGLFLATVIATWLIPRELRRIKGGDAE
jgi:hypothetical protein